MRPARPQCRTIVPHNLVGRPGSRYRCTGSCRRRCISTSFRPGCSRLHARQRGKIPWSVRPRWHTRLPHCSLARRRASADCRRAQLPAVQASGRQRRSCWQKLTSFEGLVSALCWLYVPALNAELVRGVPCLRRLRAAVAFLPYPTAPGASATAARSAAPENRNPGAGPEGAAPGLHAPVPGQW
jgi:hypothetical protein